MTTQESVAKLVKNARKISNLTQIAFAERIGRSQSLVSKYERGRAAPSASVIMNCMNILNQESIAEPSSTEVARMIESRLSAPQFAKLRMALAELIENITPEAS